MAQAAFMKNEEKIDVKMNKFRQNCFARYVQKPVCSDILTCFSVINARVAI